MQNSQNTEQSIFSIEQIKNYFIHSIENPENILGIMKSIIFAILIFWIGKLIAKWLAKIASTALTRAEMDKTLTGFVSKLVYYLVLMVTLVAALSELGIQTSSLLAIMGAAGLAIGLALKDSLSNFASGVLLVMLRPFKTGDFVEVANTSGKVLEVKIFSTILTSLDNKEIIIPNSQILNDIIVNYSAHQTRRIDIPIGVGYNDDLKTVRKIIIQTLQNNNYVMDEPEPALVLTDLGESSVNFSARVWVKTENYLSAQSDLLESIKTNLEQGGCSIPYPQRDMHIYHKSSE